MKTLTENSPLVPERAVPAEVDDRERRVFESYWKWNAAWKALLAAQKEEERLRIEHCELADRFDAEQSATGGNVPFSDTRP